jgi:muconolactone delta-isomerase
MSALANVAEIQTFVVVATVRDDANLAELAALRSDEEKQLQTLHADGRIGAHHIAPARRTAFLEVMATDEGQVLETLATLPFAKFFDLDIYQTASR